METTEATDRSIHGMTWETGRVVTRAKFALLKTSEVGIWEVYANPDYRYGFSSRKSNLRGADYVGLVEVDYEACRAELIHGELPPGVTTYAIMRCVNELDG